MADEVDDKRLNVSTRERFRPRSEQIRALAHNLADDRKFFELKIQPLLKGSDDPIDPERVAEGVTPVTDNNLSEFMAVMGKFEVTLQDLANLDIIEKFCVRPLEVK